MSKKKIPIAVLISDIHFNIHTLEVATKVLDKAVLESNRLQIPLIVAGDLHDTKASHRAECQEAILSSLASVDQEAYILVGNHDLINEKSPDDALAFVSLLDQVMVVSQEFAGLRSVAHDFYLIPYFNNPADFLTALQLTPSNALVIMHQGVEGVLSHYTQDKSAVSKLALSFANRRLISGHYHNRQHIPELNLDYIGNPYTLGFGEAKDNEKGFQILNSDGSLTFVPTNVRKHVIIEESVHDMVIRGGIKSDDIVWVKLHGTRMELNDLSKERIGQKLGLSQDFKLDKIVADQKMIVQAAQTHADTIDKTIDTLTNTEDDQKARLKELWRSLI